MVNLFESVMSSGMPSKAKAAASQAYCPYSKFRVGSVILDADGLEFTGCNVENASYGLTICAERNAIFHKTLFSVAPIVAVLIYTPTEMPSAPCGACRQVINEFGPNAKVISMCDGPNVWSWTLSDLLPAAFGPSNLTKV